MKRRKIEITTPAFEYFKICASMVIGAGFLSFVFVLFLISRSAFVPVYEAAMRHCQSQPIDEFAGMHSQVYIHTQD